MPVEGRLALAERSVSRSGAASRRCASATYRAQAPTSARSRSRRASAERGAGDEIQLTDALARQIGKHPFHGFKFDGTRFDCGNKIGFLEANIAFALARPDMAAGVRKIIHSYAKD